MIQLARLSFSLQPYLALGDNRRSATAYFEYLKLGFPEFKDTGEVMISLLQHKLHAK